jgi:hypothetical protein
MFRENDLTANEGSVASWSAARRRERQLSGNPAVPQYINPASKFSTCLGPGGTHRSMPEADFGPTLGHNGGNGAAHAPVAWLPSSV